MPEHRLQTRAKKAYNWLPNKIDRLLDVGCASGYFTIYFKNKARNVYGIDVNKEFIYRAKKKYKNIDFRLLKSKKLPFKSNFFDVVTILDVLEHVNDDQTMINEIYRILKKDGILILSVPHKGLFSFLDPDNLKITMPFLYKSLYYLIKRKNPKIVNEEHRHYNVEELNKIFNNKFRINKVHIGSSIISTIITYIEIFTSRLLNKRYFENFFINLKNIDYDINYGTFGDNIIIKAIKIK